MNDNPNGNANSNLARLEVGALSTNCWVYAYDSEISVIDPGGDAEAIIAFLESERLHPTSILLTHGHFDHILALPKVHSAFPDAVVAIHRADYIFVDENAFKRHCSDFRALAGNDSFIRANWQEMPPVARLLEDGDTIGPFTVIHTPGHTKGSVSFYHEDARVLFSGDTLFRGGIGRTDLSDGDMDAMTESLKRLFTLDGGTRVFPGHGDMTTISMEKSGYAF
jgi:glyoxylase-like metal-dependent hydrolase (beta-lactamase superfamily II)